MFAPVQKPTLVTLGLYHLLLEMTTSVTLEADTIMHKTSSTATTHYGMELDVAVPAPVVSSIILRGFVSSYHNQVLMISS